ncbi:MAG: hypothetical protein ACFB2X_16275 [Rivularia sp. (in: cyanobacteria)]
MAEFGTSPLDEIPIGYFILKGATCINYLTAFLLFIKSGAIPIVSALILFLKYLFFGILTHSCYWSIVVFYTLLFYSEKDKKHKKKFMYYI